MTTRILLAEDDAMSRFMVSEMLDSLGFAHSAVRNGAECVRLARQTPSAFALILMDVHMPQMSGLQALQHLRSADDPALQALPILAVTADQHWQDSARCASAGFSGVVAKPVSTQALKTAIFRALPHLSPDGSG